MITANVRPPSASMDFFNFSEIRACSYKNNLHLLEDLSGRRNLSIPAAAGSSPSMPLLVFWPLLAPRRWHYFSALRSAVVEWVVWYESTKKEKNYDEDRYIFFRLVAQGRRTSWYWRRPGLSPSMQHLVFWPHAGAWGAGVILPPCAQLLWCELYVMKSTKEKEKSARPT